MLEMIFQNTRTIQSKYFEDEDMTLVWDGDKNKNEEKEKEKYHEKRTVTSECNSCLFSRIPWKRRSKKIRKRMRKERAVISVCNFSPLRRSKRLNVAKRKR